MSAQKKKPHKKLTKRQQDRLDAIEEIYEHSQEHLDEHAVESPHLGTRFRKNLKYIEKLMTESVAPAVYSRLKTLWTHLLDFQRSVVEAYQEARSAQLEQAGALERKGTGKAKRGKPKSQTEKPAIYPLDECVNKEDPISLSAWQEYKDENPDADIVMIVRRPSHFAGQEPREQPVFKHCLDRHSAIAFAKENPTFLWNPRTNRPDRSVRFYKLMQVEEWVQEAALDLLANAKKAHVFGLEYRETRPIGTEFAASHLHGAEEPIFTLTALYTQGEVDNFLSQASQERPPRS